jgi:TetR/AcrR family transcriptional regulator, cholesterol catabolism regulator
VPRRAAAPRASNSGTAGATATKPRRRDAEVLAAAADIFYERGYASATVQDVADGLGMLKGSLYYYIESKEDLLYRLMDEIHDGVDEVLAEVMDAEGLTAIEKLDMYVRRQVEYNVRNLKKISVYYHDLDQLTGTRLKEIVSRRRRHENHVVSLIVQAQADGDADPALDAKLLSNCVFATIIWIYRWYRPGRGISAEQLSETCAHFALNGLRVAKPAAAKRTRKSRSA